MIAAIKKVAPLRIGRSLWDLRLTESAKPVRVVNITAEEPTITEVLFLPPHCKQSILIQQWEVFGIGADPFFLNSTGRDTPGPVKKRPGGFYLRRRPVPPGLFVFACLTLHFHGSEHPPHPADLHIYSYFLHNARFLCSYPFLYAIMKIIHPPVACGYPTPGRIMSEVEIRTSFRNRKSPFGASLFAPKVGFFDLCIPA
jgi:hypothetical protein